MKGRARYAYMKKQCSCMTGNFLDDALSATPITQNCQISSPARRSRSHDRASVSRASQNVAVERGIGVCSNGLPRLYSVRSILETTPILVGMGQYLHSRPRGGESTMKCPKCGSEMEKLSRVAFGVKYYKYWHCKDCGHEEKVKP